MTLTLEEVRATRFHLARRNGYEPSDVDDFVDKVEATLVKLNDDNNALRQQLDIVGHAEPRSIFMPEDSPGGGEIDARQAAELDAARQELSVLREANRRHDDEVAELHRQLVAKDEELEPLRAEIATLRQAAAVASSFQAPPSPTGKVENIVVTTSQQASPAVARLLQMATDQAERLVGESQVEAQKLMTEARGEAEKVFDNANRKAHETLTDARTRADRIESEARVNAEQVVAEAQSKAEAVTNEAERRRSQMFSELETERDTLRGKVEHLRRFEGTFRSNLTGHLQTQLKTLTDATFEPADTPALLTEASAASSTPRLDALLGE